MPAGTIQQLDSSARQNYARALALDPDNFSALYGYAIYESYSPNGKAHMQELLTRLNSLRSSHPQYPWQLVDYLKQHGHPQY
jgi:cytochrome c-type biogenesis protein CcmH/NrfG